MARLTHTDQRMLRLVQDLKDTLHAGLDRLCAFVKHEVQVEGWLKGEMLVLLDRGMAQGSLSGFERERLVGQGRKKADFLIHFSPRDDQSTAWLELKHWLIGTQKGLAYRARAYFSDRAIGIDADVEKLLGIDSASRYVLILCTANPGSDPWEEGLARYAQKGGPGNVQCLTDPREFPEEFYVGLLKVA